MPNLWNSLVPQTHFKHDRKNSASSSLHESIQCCLSSGPQVAMNVYELSSAAGLPCEIDPALVVALSSQKSGKTFQFQKYNCLKKEKKCLKCWEETCISWLLCIPAINFINGIRGWITCACCLLVLAWESFQIRMNGHADLGKDNK